MHLLLINPSNSLVNFIKSNEKYWHRYRVWKPLGLLVIAGLTPPEWDITIVDENLGIPDYEAIPRPDLVGVTAFTSQANRAYQIAESFRRRDIPVVMGVIHASMCQSEAAEYVDAIVTGEAESIWKTVLADHCNGGLKPLYNGEQVSMEHTPLARHDLLPTGYRLGSIQTTRGCPLNCSFCSVTSFNGGRYRHRPIPDVIAEMQSIKEEYVLIVDDNFIGTSARHIEHTKDLLRAMVKAGLNKKFITQVTINIADDEELLTLAVSAGMFGVYIGFESPNAEGLKEIHKKFNLQNHRNMRESVQRIRRHGIIVAGAFIIGLDVDEKGIGRQIADAANSYGLDTMNVMFLTPLPGTSLWERMVEEGRITANVFPADWKYYTLSYPVAKYTNFTWSEIITENQVCTRAFYSYPRILRRVFDHIRYRGSAFLTLVGNLSNRRNGFHAYKKISRQMELSRGDVPVDV